MTSEELERAIDFLLKSEARSDTRLEAFVQEGKERQDRTDEQIAQTNKALKQLTDRLDAFADTQAELMRVLTRSIEEGERFRDSQKRINESLVRVYEAQSKSQTRAEESLATSQARVNESLAAAQARAEESQARINESLRASIDELAANTEKSIGALAVKQSKTEEALAELTIKQSRTEEVVIRLAESQVQSDRRLVALIKIVEEERGR